MPMPPPRASSERPRDRHISHEMGQIVRALEVNGAQTPDDLGRLLGAEYWEKGRFDRALTFAIEDGLAVQTAEGTIAAT